MKWCFLPDCERSLVEIGFTQSQAKLYLTLLKIGQTDANTLSKHSKVPRQAIYRVLGELQEMGWVEKVVATPYKFKPVPICDCLSNFITKKAEEHQMLLKKAQLLEKQFKLEKVNTSEKEPQIIISQGKERIVQLIKSLHDEAKSNVDIITNGDRWLEILYYCIESYEKALERGVKYRVIIAPAEDKTGLLQKTRGLLANPNFRLKILRDSAKTNAAIFDGEKIVFNFYLERMLSESPIILTDHASFITMYQSHFDTLWKVESEAKEILKKGEP
jgi:sugar-specific transcriptional regulator TrmB